MLKYLKKIKNMKVRIQKFHKQGNSQSVGKEVGRDIIKMGKI